MHTRCARPGRKPGREPVPITMNKEYAHECGSDNAFTLREPVLRSVGWSFLQSPRAGPLMDIGEPKMNESGRE